MTENATMCRITAIVNKDLMPWNSTASLIADCGVEVMNIATGRSLVLQEKPGVVGRLLGGDSLASAQVEIVSFLVDSENENQALQLMADRFKLDIPGSGTAYSETLTLLHNGGEYHHVNQTLVPIESSIRMQTRLIGICCIVVRGFGDYVARVALDIGSCVPTVLFGQGAGLRDRLGLWRITIPAEKEIAVIVVNADEAVEIMNMMIDVGKLDQPGRGFIYHFPVRRGLVNMKVSRTQRSQAASIEQVVLALDELKGGPDWRRRRFAGSGAPDNKRKHLSDQVEMILQVEEGSGAELIKIAMGSGASGATISEYRYFSRIPDSTRKISPARESCSMIVGRQQVGKVMEAWESAGVFSGEIACDIYSRPVPRAFSYVAG